MKTILKILLHTVLLLIFWILAMMIGGAILPMDVPQPEGDDLTGLVILLLVSFIQVLILHYFIVNTHLTRRQLFWRVLIIYFGVQFFMSQMESLYFIREEVMSTQSVFSLVLSGLILSVGYATLVSFTYPTYESSTLHSIVPDRESGIKLILMALIIYPAIYFLAGYYIAWQSEAVRIYYSDSAEMKSFSEMMRMNVEAGLYTFQIGRTFLWVAIGLAATTALTCVHSKAALIVGLLFTVIGSAVLLLPNSIMPEEVRIYHLMETATSNFLWGAVIVWIFHRGRRQELGIG